MSALCRPYMSPSYNASFPKNRKIFSANNEQGTRIFTLGLHYSYIPSYNNIVNIFSNRPAVAGLIKKVQLSWTNQKVQLSWTNQKFQL